ncbi:MAG: class II aldolase/adducin family protein, partial [Bacteroidales bacterium]|nr:class II aldolase/adducin family protein [Bacteroidales bacterium]
MRQEIHDLVEVSRKYGSDPDYVIAGGGNTSFKDTRRIWVKASGSSMADIDEKGFVCLDREKLKILSEKAYSSDSAEREAQVKQDLANAIEYPQDKRPSVETSMHEIIDFPFVVHTHPAMVCGLLCAQKSKEMVDRLFGKDSLYIEYTDPGYVLFKAVDNALHEYRELKGTDPHIIFLENHGVFVAADTIEKIDEIYRDIVNTISASISVNPDNSNKRQDKVLNEVSESLANHPETSSYITLQLANTLTDRFVEGRSAFDAVSIPFTPDNIVYCKSKYLFVSEIESVIPQIQEFREKHGFLPKVIAVEGAG